MLTSEASYLNSLSLLNDHFIRSFMCCNLVSDEDKETLFGKISAGMLEINSSVQVNKIVCFSERMLREIAS